MAVVDVRDLSILEGNSSSRYAEFTLFLEETATAPVTVAYYLQGATATESTDDFDDRSGTATIAAGQSSLTIRTSIYGDTNIEGNETFELVVLARQNATLAGGAAALSATATILDDDDAIPDGFPGEGGLAERLMGPVAEAGLFPTLDVRGVTLIEGNSSSDPARFLITLDRPATALVTGRYYFQSETASEAGGDYDDTTGTFRIEAGQQSTWVSTYVYGDTFAESDETFQIVLTDISNAVFAGGAMALSATGTILDDDSGAPGTSGGIGDFATRISGPDPASATLPTIRIHDVSVVEGDSSSEAVRFLVTLDQPAPTAVTFYYSLNAGTAVSGLGDFDETYSRVTIPAGQESIWITTYAYGDNLIEGDEEFTVVLSQLRGAVFENGAPALEATATILDDDGGPLSGPAGIGDPGRGIAAPSGAGVVVDVVNTGIREGNSSSDRVYVHILLSEPATTRITMRYETRDGTAITGSDYSRVSGTLTMEAGDQSTWIGINVYGDNQIEGDEQFTLRLSNITGARFANGQNLLDATILIDDNDDGSAVNAALLGPQFDYQLATVGNDTLTGSFGADRILALAGDDVIYGGGGGDFIDGGAGNDQLYGGDGFDWLVPGEGSDTIDGGTGTDMASFGDYAQAVIVNLAAGTVRSGFDTNVISNVENVTGSIYSDFFTGDAGNNWFRALGGYDWFISSTGNDTYDGSNGRDMVTYINADAGVTVDLGQQRGLAGEAATHTYVEIERATGSIHADVFYGSDGSDEFRGAGGYDVFYDSGARDRYDGGTGLDTVDYSQSTGSVNASLLRGSGGPDRDLYTSIENLNGSRRDDVLTGDNGRNVLRGWHGDDALNGMGGNDYLEGGSGNDVMDGGAGYDVALYRNAASQYTVSTVGDVTTVTHAVDGIDTLTNIEALRFTDGFDYI